PGLGGGLVAEPPGKATARRRDPAHGPVPGRGRPTGPVRGPTPARPAPPGGVALRGRPGRPGRHPPRPRRGRAGFDPAANRPPLKPGSPDQLGERYSQGNVIGRQERVCLLTSSDIRSTELSKDGSWLCTPPVTLFVRIHHTRTSTRQRPGIPLWGSSPSSSRS